MNQNASSHLMQFLDQGTAAIFLDYLCSSMHFFLLSFFILVNFWFYFPCGCQGGLYKIKMRSSHDAGSNLAADCSWPSVPFWLEPVSSGPPCSLSALHAGLLTESHVPWCFAFFVCLFVLSLEHSYSRPLHTCSSPHRQVSVLEPFPQTLPFSPALVHFLHLHYFIFLASPSLWSYSCVPAFTCLLSRSQTKG